MIIDNSIRFVRLMRHKREGLCVKEGEVKESEKAPFVLAMILCIVFCACLFAEQSPKSDDPDKNISATITVLPKLILACRKVPEKSHKHLPLSTSFKVMINGQSAQGVVKCSAGSKMTLTGTTSKGDDTYIRIYEKNTSIVWYEGFSSNLNMSAWLIRTGDLDLVVENIKSAKYSAGKYQFTIQTVDSFSSKTDNRTNGAYYPGLKGSFIRLAKGSSLRNIPVRKKFVYSGKSQALSLQDEVYRLYPAYRSAESVQFIGKRNNYIKPNYFHKPFSEINGCPLDDLHTGGAALIEGNLMIKKAGQYKFRLRSSLSFKLGVNREIKKAVFDSSSGRYVLELRAVLKAGLNDFFVTFLGSEKKASLEVDWKRPEDKGYKPLRGSSFLHYISSQVEKSYSKFTKGLIHRKAKKISRKSLPPLKSNHDSDKETSKVVIDTDSINTVKGFFEASKKLHITWQKNPNVNSAIQLLELLQQRMDFLRNNSSQLVPRTFAAKIDGSLLNLLVQFRPFMEACIRHPQLQIQALECRSSLLWYTNLIFSRSFFSEEHYGTNDGYGHHNNFLLNVWRCAALWDDPLAYDMARSLEDNHFSYGFLKKECLHADGIWNFHAANGRHVNMGGYGAHWLSYVLHLGTFGTPWGKTRQQYDRLAQFVLSYEWFYYKKKSMAFSVAGRHNSHLGIFGLGFTNRLLEFPKGALSEVVRKALIKQKKRVIEKQILTGNKFFYRHLQMIHRRKDFYIDVKMNSTLVGGNETFAGHQPGNLSFGDGVTTLLKHGDEYRSIHAYSTPESLWRYRSLPGTTQLDYEYAEKTTRGKGEVVVGLDRYRRGGGSRAGGVSDGNVGHCAFEFVSNSKNSTKAKKFFAFTEDGMHVLGSAIQGSKKALYDHYTYRSNINQCSLLKDVHIQDKRGRKTIKVGDEKEIRISMGRKIWVEHNGIAYIVYPGSVAGEKSELVIRTSKRNPVNRLYEDVWAKPYMTEYRKNCEALVKQKEPRETMVLEIYIDHGAQPKDATCSYFVCMRPEKRSAKSWLVKPPVQVLSNTANLQAVRDSKDGTLHAFFYEPGILKIKGRQILRSVQPASLMLRQKKDGIFVFAQDPLAACNTNIANMSNFIDVEFRSKKLRIKMPGNTDPDDRYRGGIAIKKLK